MPAATGSGMTTWTEVRRLADELELKMHLAKMEARDRWEALKPRLSALEAKLAGSGERVEKAVERELSSIGEALHRLRADMTTPDQ